ncbi:MAG: hypothetical protein HC844_10285 [Tabrizicola sp.]|nr:hypothetical protein [Tabrizicola sp.]
MTSGIVFSPRSRLVDRIHRAAPQLTGITLLIALATLPILAAMALDGRSFQGEDIWLKPLKFHIALAIYVGSLAVYALALPPGTMTTRRWRLYQSVVLGAILAELAWISGAAALGTGSHFNLTIPGLYPLMGLAAVTLTSLSLVMGLTFWKLGTSTLHLGLAIGLILTFVLTVIVAGTMSNGTGHHIGTVVTGARIPVMGWSREAGDLRVAHFLATHAMHAVPLAALTGARPVVWGVAVAYTAITFGAFVQALLGLPLI